MRILLVDDDNACRRSMARALEALGHSVVALPDALAALAALRGAFDLVILDVRLRGDLDGWELLRIKTETPQMASVPVILLSGLMTDGASIVCLSKPVSVEILLAMALVLANSQTSGIRSTA